MKRVNSTAGYMCEILAEQVLQCPLRNKKLNSGIFSHHLSRLAQERQCDGGQATDSPAGILMMHTFAKLPSISPSTPEKIVVSQSGSSLNMRA